MFKIHFINSIAQFLLFRVLKIKLQILKVNFVILASYNFINLCRSKDKTFVLLEYCWHNLLSEPESDFIVEFLVNWIRVRL